jgi:DMSO/TMAO reductase YedYZ molybdopterin-dependent catalytic subunit
MDGMEGGDMQQLPNLPPGQREATKFERFGLPTFIRRFPKQANVVNFTVAGDVQTKLTVNAELTQLTRIEQVSDFHCVTTWSYRALRWSGFSFADFYARIVVPQARPAPGAVLVVFRAQDGYASSLLLEDLLAPNVLLCDRLGGDSLGIEHGAPLRLIAPAHYGYKNVKHIEAIEFWRDASHYRFPRPYPRLMDHPRARVALEERGIGIPPWLLRTIYRTLIPSTLRASRRALARYRAMNPRD